MKKNLTILLALCFIGAHAVKGANDFQWHNPNRDLENVIAHVVEKGDFPEGFDPFNCSFTTSRSFSGLLYHASAAQKDTVFRAIMSKLPTDSTEAAALLNSQSASDSGTALDELLQMMTTNKRVDDFRQIFETLVLRGARLTKKTADFYRTTTPFHKSLQELIGLGVPADALWKSTLKPFVTSSRSWHSGFNIPQGYEKNIEDLLSLLPHASALDKEILLTLIANYSSASWLKKAMPLARALLDAEISPEIKNYALTLAASKNSTADLTALLVERGARVTLTEVFQRPPLHNALNSSLDQEERTRKMTALLQAGADINEKDTSYFCQTPLMLARTAADIEFIRNAHTTVAGVQPVNLDEVDDFGRTALFWAAEEGRIDLIKSLITAGADKEKGRYKGETALDIGRRTFKQNNNKEAYEALEDLFGVAHVEVQWPKPAPETERPPTPRGAQKEDSDETSSTKAPLPGKTPQGLSLPTKMALGTGIAAISYVVYCRAKWNSLDAEEKELYQNSFIKFCYGKKQQ